MSDTECRHCRHCNVQDTEIGQCRRYPPDNFEDDEGVSIEWPLVKLEMWCGEFSRKVN